MTIKISADKTLKQISEEFSAKFPYLRLKFYSEAHAVGEKSSLWDTLNMSLPISEVGKFDHEEELHLDGHLKTATLEQEFQRLYGIGLQVFRQDGKEWIQTSNTDHWTLAQQNREGHADSITGVNI
ncbi:MAG: hypothetical protein EAZ89_03765 [Bacteroidetes bacterium]|jgi:hypothetical protein|nr:MAG: hypothetical protein EAZ89_03765 [Bacteroidota bacterium]